MEYVGKIEGNGEKIWIRFAPLEFANLIAAYFQGSGKHWDEAVNEFVKSLNSQGFYIKNLASVM